MHKNLFDENVASTLKNVQKLNGQCLLNNSPYYEHRKRYATEPFFLKPYNEHANI